MGAATIQVTYWNSGLSREETKIKCIEKLTEIRNHINGEIPKLNKSSLGEIDFVLKCLNLQEYINDEKHKYDDCFKDNSININPDVKKSIELVIQKCDEDNAEIKELQTDQEEPIDLKAKPEESPTEHEDCKKETAVEGKECETKLENGAVTLEAQQLTDQGKQELNGGLSSESDPNTVPEGNLRESIAVAGEDKSRSSSSNLAEVAGPKADSPAGDSGDTMTVNSRVSSREESNDIGATDDLRRTSSQSEGDSSLPVATTGSSTFPNFSSSVVTETSDNGISFTCDTQHIKIFGNSSTGTYVEGKTTGSHPPTEEQPSAAASSSYGDLSTSEELEMGGKSSRGEHGDSAGKGIDGKQDQQRAVSGQEQSTETHLTYGKPSSDGQIVRHDQSSDAGLLGSIPQQNALEGYTTQDTSHREGGPRANESERQINGHLSKENIYQRHSQTQDHTHPTGSPSDGGKLTTEDGNSSILHYELGGITIKTYITIGLSILGFILLLTFLIKFTAFGRIFSKKKKKNRQTIQEELHRIMYSPSSLEEQNIYMSYGNSEYSQYDSQY
ncbi:PIR Superfamily Protein [Plasmodium ovale curtisi]|uniref:PIR Superfamily Protein n=1 Tax=Plasmodium ovale curtisi TaxID=864141 RepID=A0A1A8WJZ7_PLAOA|nr:PIR Superfamily Protein [Plasmodium ovale curtisi]